MRWGISPSTHNKARAKSRKEASELFPAKFSQLLLEHDGKLLFLRVNFHLNSLRSDPRFQDLPRRMNFPK
jgi:hypothetical protein